MSKFFLCPDLVEHSKYENEYWLHILLPILQTDHVKINVDKNPQHIGKSSCSKIINEYWKIAKNNKNIEIWVINLVNYKNKNLRTIKFKLPSNSHIKDDFFELAKQLELDKRMVICRSLEDYDEYSKKAKNNSVHFIDKDDAKLLLETKNKDEFNIFISKLINQNGLIGFGDGSDLSIKK